MPSESNDDLYDVLGKLERRLVRDCIDIWRRENETRCARILGEFPRGKMKSNRLVVVPEGCSSIFPHELFERWIIKYPPRAYWWRKGGALPTIFYPLADRVLIKPEDMGGEKRSPSGLVIIPDLGKTRSNTGFILAIGPDCDGIELGDKVLFGKYAGSDIELNGEAVVICRMEDILGVITEEPDEGSIDESPDEPDPPA